MNPYRGVDFFHFFSLLFSRFFQGPLASDEIQVLVLSLVAISSALLGTLLVLKKMTMLANSLSHTLLLGIVISYLLLFPRADGLIMNFQILFMGAVITALITTVLTQFFHHVLRLQEDASIGLVFTSLFALGILLVTLYTRNAHIGLEVVMGNVDALHVDDLNISAFMALLNLFIMLLFFKGWKMVTFDPSLATTLGYRPQVFFYFLMFLTSATAISAFRAVGVLLFLAFLVGPPLTARLLTHSMGKMLALACSLGIGASLLGVATSRHLLSVYGWSLSTGGLVVVFIGLFFILAAGMRQLTFSQISP